MKETDKIHFVEVIMPSMDAPKSLVLPLKVQENTKNENNKYKQMENNHN